MTDAEHRSGNKTSWQPFLDILQLAINKILHNEDSHTKDSMKENFAKLRKNSPNILRAEKEKYDALVEKGKEKEFEDETISFMYEAGVNAGKFLMM